MYRRFDKVKSWLGKTWHYCSRGALLLYDAALATDIFYMLNRRVNITPLTTNYFWRAMEEAGLNPLIETGNVPVHLNFLLFLASVGGASTLTYYAFFKKNKPSKEQIS